MNIFYRIIEKIYLTSKDNLVYFDSITKCRTRWYYDNIIIKKYLKERCKICFIDIDNLKQINDQYGHHNGTLVILNIARLLLSLNNTYDICRIGGDEFIIIANENFDENILKDIPNISYGCYLKHEYELVQDAVCKSDELMYKNKLLKKET